MLNSASDSSRTHGTAGSFQGVALFAVARSRLNGILFKEARRTAKMFLMRLIEVRGLDSSLFWRPTIEDAKNVLPEFGGSI